ncbi:SIR2 family protein [Methylocystis echinoides]|uniref:SIR2 family protein n=2 Tax=Methylocystis echinoides TaxID=29468 RepID=A0A9W6GYH1_9HYPH|nr:SIR2 family protein [Methylocystis echinoides]
MPLGDTLRDSICDKFFDGKLKHLQLTAVAAMAATEVGLTHLQKYIRDLFFEFQPGDFHLLVPTFRWRAIASTNFDLIIERAYEKARGSVQTLVKSVKDGDLFDTRMREVSDPVGFLKLHGCIDSYTDSDVPLILGQDQYASYATNRTRFYARLRDYGFENPIVFCGYSIADAHIQQVLFDLTDKSIKRPMFYNISPGLSDIESRYWSGHQVTCIPATFEQFLRELDNKITSVARQLRRPDMAGQLSLATHYRVARATESDSLRSFIERDVSHLHGGFVASPQDAREFYRGYDTGFGCITQSLDIRRPITDSIIVDAILADDNTRKNAEFFLIKAPAGNGKTVALKRVAWEAGISYEKIVLYAEGAAGIRIEPIEEIFSLTGKRIYLFVDRVALYRTELKKLLDASRSRKIPLTVLGAERENEWNIYCDQLEPFVLQDFSIGYLSRDEISELLKKLEEHRALGLLSDRTPEERIDAFSNRANSQLLVALHETTMGVPFEKIILDEYERIKPREAQSLYLQICALHQFGAPVRAGLVSRVSKISFTEFSQRFLKPLAEVVLVDSDKHVRGDIFYRSRHRHVAELVFNQALVSEEDRYDLLATLISSINIDYSSDRETFSRLIRGRNVITMFANVNLGRLLFEKAEAAAKGDSFVLQQRAVFELHHPQGSLDEASEAALRAATLSPNNRSIKHTQAEVARRQALETQDPLRKQSYRKAARGMLGGDIGMLTEYDLWTRAKVALDELREMLGKPGTVSADADSAVLAATKEAEGAIEKARSSFPESSDLLAAEAELQDLLNNAPKALSALEKAFKINPRQDWLAVRLARRYEADGNRSKAIEVMQHCLRENADSRSAHLELAHFLKREGANRKDILGHLRQSFAAGDNNFEAQFWYARELFIDNRASDAKSVFDSLNERAWGRFRTTAAAIVEDGHGNLLDYNGSVSRKEEGYAFVKPIDFPLDIFASRAASAREDWDRLRAGSQIVFNLAFNRRGPQAVNITLRRT